MATVFFVTSICDHATKITAKLKDSNIELALESTCKKIQDYSLLIKNLTLRDITMEILRNPIYAKASEARLEPNCLVPCGVAFCAWTEAGLVSRTLLSRYPSQCLTFKVD